MAENEIPGLPAEQTDEEKYNARFISLLSEAEIIARAEKDVAGLADTIKDGRRLELIRRNARVQAASIWIMEREPLPGHLSNAFRMADTIYKGIEQQARLLGLKLNTEITIDQLDTAESVVAAVQEFNQKIRFAMNQLETSNPEEYAKLKAELEMQRKEEERASKPPKPKEGDS